MYIFQTGDVSLRGFIWVAFVLHRTDVTVLPSGGLKGFRLFEDLCGSVGCVCKCRSGGWILPSQCGFGLPSVCLKDFRLSEDLWRWFVCIGMDSAFPYRAGLPIVGVVCV